MKSIHVQLEYTEDAPETFDKDLRVKLNDNLSDLGLKVVSIGDFGTEDQLPSSQSGTAKPDASGQQATIIPDKNTSAGGQSTPDEQLPGHENSGKK
ncbi:MULTISPECIES: hypothetical protein [Fictibacillus]|uniref:Uncharacterized protein n=1 Tax=Fictibacillus terranigra TaxID=3058424 RepID=A0ABT8E2I9_9BACL|nr:hypothetical protein [Fictibacillus sp. CENA-BCM004]MDN4072103.1 hypothetical protein [Fictibacillus sp. CENA-BCM004]